MLINNDFTELAVVKNNEYQWHSSPQVGIERVYLDRIGEEVARATSLVRFAADSIQPRHTHDGGEEIFVLSGTFSEGDKDYPAGYYLRNPPGSEHQPSSRTGALIFVKLRQMHSGDKSIIRVNTENHANWIETQGTQRCPLFSNHVENVYVQHFPANNVWHCESERLTELLVLSGDISIEDEHYDEGSWIRFPADSSLKICIGQQGAKLFVKHYELA